jgi:hypothetical protein
MPTIEQALAYNAARKNEAWLDLTNAAANALLQDAEDYIRGAYPIRSDLSIDDYRMFDGIVCRLASIFQTNPPQVVNRPALKVDIKEGAGFKKEQEFFEVGSDPYPYITAVIRPFLQRETGSSVIVGVVRP